MVLRKTCFPTILLLTLELLFLLQGLAFKCQAFQSSMIPALPGFSSSLARREQHNTKLELQQHQIFYRGQRRLYASNSNNEDEEVNNKAVVAVDDNDDTPPPPSPTPPPKEKQKPSKSSSNQGPSRNDFSEKRRRGPVEGFLETIIPPIVPVFAFLYYDVVTDAFQRSVKYIARNTWLNDGSKDPTIFSALNSIVIPTSAILYATLTATTVNALRQRQQSIREGLNKEASELRILQNLLQYFPDNRQNRFRLFLIQYTSRVIGECQPIVNLEKLESKGQESEINDMIREVNAMVAQDHDDDDRTNDILIFQAYDAMVRLKNHRAERLSAVQNTLPVLHYIVLFSLALSITAGFLIETNKAKVDYDAFQLRILWTQLVASFSALGVILYDLNQAFGGNYQVQGATDQIYTIRFSLTRDYVEKTKQIENMF